MEQVTSGNYARIKEDIEDDIRDYDDDFDDVEDTNLRDDDDIEDTYADTDVEGDDIEPSDLEEPIEPEAGEEEEIPSNTREGFFVDVTEESPTEAGQYLVVVAGTEDGEDRFALATYSPEDDTFSVDGETAEVKYWEPLPVIPGADIEDDFEDDDFKDSDTADTDADDTSDADEAEPEPEEDDSEDNDEDSDEDEEEDSEDDEDKD